MIGRELEDALAHTGALEAEIERLRTQCGGHCRYWEGRWRDEAAENERLRALVCDAYNAGFGEGMCEATTSRGGIPWSDSRLRVALERSAG
jgi:hypothetical protein